MENTVFNAQIKNVVRWNAVANKGQHIFDKKALTLQTNVTHSEIKETIAAIASDDVVEVLDGVADVFVTLAYKYFLTTRSTEFKMSVADEGGECLTIVPVEQSFFELSVINDLGCIMDLNLNTNDKDDTAYAMCILYDLINKVEQFYGVSMADVIQDVMDSNWTKYPKRTEKCTDDVLDERSVSIGSLRGYKDVHWLISNVDGVEYVVYRANFGAGKIMKPLSYTAADPGKFLQQQVVRLAS
jgi:hypothetical protein